MKIKLLFLGVAAVVFAAFTSGCQSDKVEDAPLKNTVWIPTSIIDQGDAKLNHPEAAWLFIADNNRVNGRGGVNGFFGGVSIESDGKIKFSQMGSTLMAGPNLPFETKFLKTLEEAVSYQVRGKILVLFNKDGRALATFTVGPDRLKPIR